MGFTEKATQSFMKSTALMNNIQVAIPSFIHEIRKDLKTKETGHASLPLPAPAPQTFAS